MSKIVGILGGKGCGKDTAGEYLIERYGFKRYAFGDPVKATCKSMFNLTDAQLTWEKKEEIDPRWGISPRRMFQTIGTEFGQYDIHKYFPEINNNVKNRNFWTYLFELWLKDHKNDKIVITDVRFKHEVDCILNHGGEIVKISRPDIMMKDYHISEQELKDIHISREIVNDGTVEDMYSQLDLVALIPF